MSMLSKFVKKQVKSVSKMSTSGLVAKLKPSGVFKTALDVVGVAVSGVPIGSLANKGMSMAQEGLAAGRQVQSTVSAARAAVVTAKSSPTIQTAASSIATAANTLGPSMAAPVSQDFGPYQEEFNASSQAFSGYGEQGEVSRAVRTVRGNQSRQFNRRVRYDSGSWWAQWL